MHEGEMKKSFQNIFSVSLSTSPKYTVQLNTTTTTTF